MFWRYRLKNHSFCSTPVANPTAPAPDPTPPFSPFLFEIKSLEELALDLHMDRYIRPLAYPGSFLDMVEVTTNALAAIRREIEITREPAIGLRIMAEFAGCEGLRYSLGLDTESMEGDLVFRYDEISILIDEDSCPLLEGARLDFVSTDETVGFVIDNPFGRGTCSCGSGSSRKRC